MMTTEPLDAAAAPLEITPKAVAMAKQKLQEVGSEAVGLRLGVRGGGCSGYAYVIDYAKKIRPERDQSFDFSGLTVVIDRRSLEFLAGCTLDWEKKLLSYGFKWLNPRVKGGCGCGTSFQL